MKKAEIIFNNTRLECKKYIKSFGYKDDNGGFCCLITEEKVTTRTKNAIQKLIDNEIENIKIDYEIGVITEDIYKFDMNVMDMVQKTLNSHFERYNYYVYR